jgi:23S rRNA 5-hydroxycytidine C2501 synthase
MRKLELLAPARDLVCGKAAIDHGADAVYIGASRFGARAAAGNSVADIETLAQYAHRYHSKVFVALNTVLTDDQLGEAEKLIQQIYEAGADALIIQDMGILEMSLPPIALHASTQTDNRSLQKVNFLQHAGFSRVVLARELELEQVRHIAANTEVELEAFVHGALCVSYSGQCYISQAAVNRSANRGECAQFCRLPYNLTDSEGKTLISNKHLLSLKDLDLSDSLQELAEAGITSFKIEGRLKGEDYVKNITAFYRKKLDNLMDSGVSGRYRRASSGRTTFFFEPDPAKTFRRSSTDYFLHGRHQDIVQTSTPKSIGEPVGSVLFAGNLSLRLNTGKQLHNGDGLSFFNQQGELEGFRVNRVEKDTVFPASMPKIEAGTTLFRNQDQQFEQILQGRTAERKVAVSMRFEETMQGFSLKVRDEDDLEVQVVFEAEKQLARQPEKVEQAIRAQLSKTGNTIFEVSDISIQMSQPWFFAASALNELRRTVLEMLENKRIQDYQREKPATKQTAFFPEEHLTYLGNVTNKLSAAFYRKHGVKTIDPGFEVKAAEGVPLMFTKHCIKYEMGFCPRTGSREKLAEPLYLRHKHHQFKLSFDCVKCEMQVSTV